MRQLEQLGDPRLVGEHLDGLQRRGRVQVSMHAEGVLSAVLQSAEGMRRVGLLAVLWAVS